MKHVCDNCGKKWDLIDIVFVDDLQERVDPGGTMPSGECRDCGALCYPEKSKPKQPTNCRLLTVEDFKGIGVDFTSLASIVDKTVYVASVSTPDGNDLFVHSTNEGMTDALYKFISDRWEESMGRRPIKDKQRAIDKYFEQSLDDYLEWIGPIKINK